MILQVCPSDYPPFAEICTAYEAAFNVLGQDCRTIILRRPSHDPVSGFTYLYHDDLNRTVYMTQLLRELMPGKLPVDLAICQRYRAGRVAAPISRRRVVVAHEFGYFKRWQRRITPRFERDTVYAGVSPAVTDELASVARETMLLPNAVDPEVMEMNLLSREEARQLLNLPAEGKLVGWVGRLHHKKRPQLAVAAIGQTRPDISLAVLGEGPLKVEPPPDRVTYCGFVADGFRYFKAFDVLLMTAADIEAFGMTALEAMVAGVPVVCSRVPGPAFVLGDCGCYYESDDAGDIARAVEAAFATDLHSYRQAARERVEKMFSIQALAQRLQPLLSET